MARGPSHAGPDSLGGEQKRRLGVRGILQGMVNQHTKLYERDSGGKRSRRAFGETHLHQVSIL